MIDVPLGPLNGRAYELGSCDWVPESDNGPIYSADPAEETRMLTLRDNPGNRVTIMAQRRAAIGRQVIPFHDTELNWLSESFNYNPIPLLSPQEYDAMIRGLTRDLIIARRQVKATR